MQDLFLTETARLADVVLPAATWGEKTRHVHQRRPHRAPVRTAVDPPGEARSDLDIFLDYARRMDFRDRDGGPLITWHDPESAFEAWKACSRGRPCDYTGITYDRLRGGVGIQWPCTAAHPDGTERLYTDGTFNTDPDYCETFGHDLATGAASLPTSTAPSNRAAERSFTPSTTRRLTCRGYGPAGSGRRSMQLGNHVATLSPHPARGLMSSSLLAGLAASIGPATTKRTPARVENREERP